MTADHSRPTTAVPGWEYVAWLEHERARLMADLLTARAEIRTLRATVQDLADQIVKPV